VPRDSAAALAWFARAAAQGHPGAQFNLGILYSSGPSKDVVRAYMWADLAARSGEPDAVRLRDSLTTLMTGAELADAQRAVREWKPERR
jgi:TPR repeat protein